VDALDVRALRGDLGIEGELTNVTHIAGADGEESIWQPEWSPTGELVFASDRSGWWNRADPRRRSLGFTRRKRSSAIRGGCSGRARSRSLPMGASCARTARTGSRFGLLDPETAPPRLELGLDSCGGNAVRPCRRLRVVVVAGSSTVPNQVAVIDTLSAEVQILRSSSDLP
jgi:hypothetical protein